jgi:hypothetical protein
MFVRANTEIEFDPLSHPPSSLALFSSSLSGVYGHYGTYLKNQTKGLDNDRASKKKTNHSRKQRDKILFFRTTMRGIKGAAPIDEQQWQCMVVSTSCRRLSPARFRPSNGYGNENATPHFRIHFFALFFFFWYRGGPVTQLQPGPSSFDDKDGSISVRVAAFCLSALAGRSPLAVTEPTSPRRTAYRLLLRILKSPANRPAALPCEGPLAVRSGLSSLSLSLSLALSTGKSILVHGDDGGMRRRMIVSICQTADRLARRASTESILQSPLCFVLSYRSLLKTADR